MSKEKDTHTPGPLVVDAQGGLPIYINAGADELARPVAEVNSLEDGIDNDARRVEQAANARLLTAAFNSYDRHCGSRAVKCAERDLLGELLEAHKRIASIERADGEYDRHDMAGAIVIARAALALVEKGA